MNAITAFIKRLTGLGGIVSGACILAITFLILAEIVFRAVLDRSTFIAEEYSAYLMANFAFLGLAYTLKSGGHIRVNLVLSKLKGRRRQCLEVLCCLVGMVVFAVLSYQLWLLVVDSFVTGTESMNVTKTKIFIPQCGLLLGAVMMTLQFALQSLEHLFIFSGRLKNADETGTG